jgi:hypothetical protein
VRIPMPEAKVRSTCFGVLTVGAMLDDDRKEKESKDKRERGLNRFRLSIVFSMEDDVPMIGRDSEV